MLKLCVEPEDHREIMEDAHISLGGIHEAEWKTTQRILLNGYWWPTLESDVVQFVANYAKCSQETPVSFATLYSIMPTPNWASYMVEYLKHGNDNANMPKHRACLIG